MNASLIQRRARRHTSDLALTLAAVLLAGLGLVATPRPAVAASAPTNAPMILVNVSWQDLQANVNGICDAGKAGRFTHLLKNVSATATPASAANYLTVAAKCGYKVFFHFSATISGGTVYPSRVARWVAAVKSSPTLAGYLSVKEPSWIGINATEIRSLYKAFRAADPAHPVMALFGDIPNFGDSANPYTAGMADIVMVDWYPVETGARGCSTRGTTYVANGPKWLSTKVKPRVAARTPGVPVYVMVQTHKYLAPRCHKKQLPTKALLERQVREAFIYGGARGIAFHTWSNTNYQSDQKRNPTLFGWMKSIADRVHAGTF